MPEMELKQIVHFFVCNVCDVLVVANAEFEE